MTMRVASAACRWNRPFSNSPRLRNSNCLRPAAVALAQRCRASGLGRSKHRIFPAERTYYREEPPLPTIPYSADINDISQINRKNITSEFFGRMIRRQCDVLLEEGQTNCRVM